MYQEDLEDYRQCVRHLGQYSPQAKLFCLVHKMDLLPKDERKKVIGRKGGRTKTRNRGLT
jgi:Ras-related GTP-binding protein A/B